MTMINPISFLYSQLAITPFSSKRLKIARSFDKNILNNDLVLDIKVGLIYARQCTVIDGHLERH